MSAPNSQPVSIGGMAAPNEHEPYQIGLVSSTDDGRDTSALGEGTGLQPSTPAPVGAGKVNPLK